MRKHDDDGAACRGPEPTRTAHAAERWIIFILVPRQETRGVRPREIRAARRLRKIKIGEKKKGGGKKNIRKAPKTLLRWPGT